MACGYATGTVWDNGRTRYRVENGNRTRGTVDVRAERGGTMLRYISVAALLRVGYRPT